MIMTGQVLSRKNQSILSYIKEKPQFRYFCKNNGGIASARSFGLWYALGLYITFCDQDDFVEQGYLKFWDQIIEEKADILITEFQYYRNDETYPAKRIIDDRILEKRDVRNYAVKLIDEENINRLFNPENKNMKVSGSVWNCIFQKKLLDNHRICFRRYIDYEDDWIFVIECLSAAEKAILTSESYYYWNMNEKSESHTSKYVPVCSGIPKKRKAAVRWMRQQLRNLECGEEEIRRLSRYLLNRRTLIWDFYNECYKSPFSFKDYCKEMSKAVKSEFHHIEYRKLMKTNKSRGENIILYFMKYHLFLSTYLFNILVYKHKYH